MRGNPLPIIFSRIYNLFRYTMADDDEEKKDTGEDGEDGEDGEGEGEGTFSKVGGMFGGGDDKEKDSSAEKEKPNQKAKPKSLFDINALKEFGLSVLALLLKR